MDYKYIEALLEKYWQCETSLEEEALLRNFFLNEEVPAQWMRYKDLFVYQQCQQQLKLGEDFDARVLAKVEPVVVKARRLTWISRCFPLFKAAAVIFLFLSLGNVSAIFFSMGEEPVLAGDTIDKQFSAPSVVISSENQKKQQALVDSLTNRKRQQSICDK